MMTIARLREVRSIRKEIDDLERLRETLYFPISSPTFSEFHGTSPSDPTARAFDSLQRLDEQIDKSVAKLREEVCAVNEWLDTIEDSELRRIIICHYLTGMTWEQTTRHVLGYYGTDSARMRVYRYFGKCNDM